MEYLFRCLWEHWSSDWFDVDEGTNEISGVCVVHHLGMLLTLTIYPCGFEGRTLTVRIFDAYSPAITIQGPVQTDGDVCMYLRLVSVFEFRIQMARSLASESRWLSAECIQWSRLHLVFRLSVLTAQRVNANTNCIPSQLQCSRVGSPFLVSTSNF